MALRFDPNKAVAGERMDVQATAHEILNDPLLNKGTAFTEAERDAFNLHGLLPPRISSLFAQSTRRLSALRHLESDLERYTFLRGLQDNNETLFYALLTENLEECLPIVYTPTVGLGCQQYSHIYQRPRGLYLSPPLKDRFKQIFSHPRFDYVEAIVVSDGERILGLGDQGAGGMGIPIGKLSLYTACAGLHPATTLPILLDVGTDNEDRLKDPLYIGWHHERLRGAEYDEFVEAFVSAVQERWPHVMLQWEDFARANATRLLKRYRDRLCTFNDDVQGTAAVATAAVLAAAGAVGQSIADQRICIVGAGSAGSGIANLLLRAMVDTGLSEEEARKRFFLIDVGGLLTTETADLMNFQEPFAKAPDDLDGWNRLPTGEITLEETIRQGQPTVLIGTSAQPGTFTEKLVRMIADYAGRPIIMPLSNPTSRAEATPADLVKWTDGQAIIGTGSPFPPIEKNGKPFKVDQTNNSYVFPGVGLGVIAVKARHISDDMMMAAAKAVAELSPARLDPEANLLPPVSDLRAVAKHVAKAVALKALEEGHCDPFDPDKLDAVIATKMWTPEYVPYTKVRETPPAS